VQCGVVRAAGVQPAPSRRTRSHARRGQRARSQRRTTPHRSAGSQPAYAIKHVRRISRAVWPYAATLHAVLVTHVSPGAFYTAHCILPAAQPCACSRAFWPCGCARRTLLCTPSDRPRAPQPCSCRVAYRSAPSRGICAQLPQHGSGYGPGPRVRLMGLASGDPRGRRGKPPPAPSRGMCAQLPQHGPRSAARAAQQGPPDRQSRRARRTPPGNPP
jgi:hypothetical protein